MSKPAVNRPRLRIPPELDVTISVPEAGALLHLKEGASYRAAKRGEIPTIRVGDRLWVPTAEFLTMLGFERPTVELRQAI